jgi:hypothetical protein
VSGNVEAIYTARHQRHETSGKSLRYIGTAAQVFELLHSPTVPLAMMSNAVAYQETFYDERLTKLHSISTAIGKAKQQ